MRRTQPPSRRDATRLYPVIGLVVLAALAGIAYVSYTANTGLPLQRRYRIDVVLPDAKRLAKTNDVRIGGLRVGQVARVQAFRPGARQRVRARIELALNRSVGRLPIDTQVKVRSASILGATYLDVIPGRSTTTIPDGGELPLARSLPTVELTDLLDVFNRGTARSAQAAFISLGDGLAGRGGGLNQTIASVAELLPPLGVVGTTLASRGARLPQFIDGLHVFTRALAPVSGDLARLTAGGERTFGALARKRAALASSIEEAVPAERSTIAALGAARPDLVRLADLLTEVGQATPRLRPSLREVNRILAAGVPPLRALPPVGTRLRSTLRALDARSRDRATDGAVRKLTQAVRAAETTLEVLTPAQRQCNIVSLWAETFGWGFGGPGFSQGPALVSTGITHYGALGEFLQSPTPSPGIAINNTPHENTRECEAGNEPYPETFPVFNPPTKPQLIGNPAGDQANTTVRTRQPPGVRELAREAGVQPTVRAEP
ncbi:MlaD family protein [Paraconexibacter antarcticus]|uniref:MlaD family protein n=1 Tax=Paraconexibacter antarcticus TaxID=2949664 RepID=A0ABY5DYF8_9ACTN|nr:MlaD family protein [Paraconexibacter antarcticus]UTI67071.1 MlaD family protein [Paraconexibacter antarcticus]